MEKQKSDFEGTRIKNDNGTNYSDFEVNGIKAFSANEVCGFNSNNENKLPLCGHYVSGRGLKRYGNAIKHLLPFRRSKRASHSLRIDDAGLFSILTFSWMSEYIYKAYKKNLTLEDIPLGSILDSCSLNADRLEFLWEKELILNGLNKASFGKVVWQFIRTRVIMCSLIFCISCLMGYVSSTVFMRNLLHYLEEPNESILIGIMWALALTSSEILRTVFFGLYYGLSYRTAVRLRAACLMLVYKKILRLNSAGNSLIGEVINIFGLDGPRLHYMVVFGPMTIGGILISIFGFLYVYFILGPWALIGMLIFILYYPFQYFLSHLAAVYRQKAVIMSDKKIKLVTEILTTMKMIKMYAWESWFFTKVQDVREKELKEIEKISYCQSVGITLTPTIPVLAGMVTFLVHVLTGGNLNAAQAFSMIVLLTKQMKTSIQIIRDGGLAFKEGFVSVKRFKVYTVLVILQTQLRKALLDLRYGSDNVLQGYNVCNRFQDILTLKENPTNIKKAMDESLAILIENGFFSWNTLAGESNYRQKNRKKNKQMIDNKQNSTEVLHSINFIIRKGALIGICGPVGAGKSSLLLACLGQLEISSGQIYRNGSCAYVSQQSWIENTSLRNNILFGEKFDSEKYNYVLQVCALKEDVNSLSCGDETEIGERGVNLSGGQKQRISLARALYSDRDIYFLDDPLSAVDPLVGSQIFQNYILEALCEKTVLLITRQVQYLKNCDEVIVMKEGHIVEQGKFEELMTNGKEFQHLVLHDQSSSFQTKVSENANDSQTNEYRDTDKTGAQNGFNGTEVKLTVKEDQIYGTIKASAYYAYLNAAGGYFIGLMVMFIIFINVGSNVFSSWWLAMWIKSGSGNTTLKTTNAVQIVQHVRDDDPSFYMQIYGSIIGLILITCIIRGFIYTRATIRASRVLHGRLFEKVVYSPLRYFEKTPIGQIQNLFTRDMDEIDSRLPESVETMLQNIWSVAFSFLTIILVFPWFTLPFTILGFVYYSISRIFRVAIRDLKRMEHISRAPIYSYISATIQGLSTIHAFSKEADSIMRFTKIFDENSTIFFLTSNAMRWMAVRMDFISVIITFITSILVAVLKGDVAPAFAGLALTYAAQVCGVFQYTIRLLSENEARFISVERVHNNINKLQTEGNSGSEIEIQKDWPKNGAVKFHQVKLCYGEGLRNVLNNISFSVFGGEKIGVVGRTGAGKSSLITALFRLVEVSSGSIYIDELNIANVPLKILRSRLSVIPQDPILFSGSLRLNLDPLNKYEDNTLWQVLSKTRLSGKVKSMPNQLLAKIGEEENLSVGEKQLLCMARALLYASKILILDEATASIDLETEMAIQLILQEEFQNCTIITIAHRLSTVTSCDRILVINEGMVMEFDSPNVLMKNPNSQFSKMLATSGIP